jgi:phosphoglucosamine mutase
MKRKFFGTDGIRGCVGESPITPDFILRLGYAVGRVVMREDQGGRPAVLIGKDTRVSGYMLEAALQAGFTAAGVDVRLTGPMPTPAIAYLTRALRLAAGVVISASHNPFQDNGIKFFSSAGEKLPDRVELEIEEELDKPIGCVPSKDLGRAQRITDAAGRYIEFCKATFPQEFTLRGRKIVVDCAHGAAYDVAPHVFHELGAEVVAIGASPNGFNINAGCGATHPEALQAAVREHGADVGIALDGDADRLIMADAKGRLYNGDELLYVLVADGLANGKRSGVAGTLMTNLAVEHALQRLGVPFGRANVGDRYVLELMRKNGWMWGGESSGHLLCLDKHTTGDGIVSALQVLSAMCRDGRTLSELTHGVDLYPQRLINLRVPTPFDWTTCQPLQAERLAVEAELGEEGRVLIRPSGTEPLLRVMVEARSADIANAAAQRLASVVPQA